MDWQPYPDFLPLPDFTDFYFMLCNFPHGIWMPFIRDQGDCGACVPFSMCDIVAILLAMLHQQAITPLSPQCVLDFVHRDPAIEHLDGCATTDAYDLFRTRGVVREVDLQYLMRRRINPPFPMGPRVYIDTYVELDLMEVGTKLQLHPLLAMIPLSKRFQSFQGPDVFKPVTDEDYVTFLDAFNELHGVFHSVLVVGGGVLDDGTYFYVIKNSWGLRFGYGGFAKVVEELFSYFTCPVNPRLQLA